MPTHTAGPGIPGTLIDSRRARIIQAFDHVVEPVQASPSLSREQADFLLKDAEDLYWNELAWEEITDEERVSGGHLTELVFPGFLAFVDALLLESSPRGVDEAPRPHPEVVEEILLFLAERHADPSGGLEQGADSERLVRARAMTTRLIDLVLYRLYRLSDGEREEIESREE